MPNPDHHRPRLLAALLLAAALPAVPTAAQSEAQFPTVGSGRVVHTEAEDAPLGALKTTIGRGFNTFTSSLRGDCVAADFEAPASEGFTSETEVRLIQSSDDLKRETSIDVSASAGLGKLSVDASASFHSSVKISSNSDYLLVRVTARGPSATAANIAFTPLATRVAADRNKFFTACGNRFVSEVQLGGEFLALLEFTASSETDRTEVRTNLKAATAAVSLNASFQSAIETAQSKSSMHSTISRRGTSDSLPSFSVAELIAYAQAFPSKLNVRTAVPVGLVLEDYETVDPDISTFQEDANVADVREGIAAGRRSLGEIAYLSDLYSRLDLPGKRGQLATWRAGLQSGVTAAERALDACGHAPWASSCAEIADVPKIIIPRLPSPPAVTTVTATHGNNQFVGTVEDGEEKILLLEGRFYYDNDGHQAEMRGSSVIVEDLDGKQMAVSYQPPVRIKGPARVYIRAPDSEFGDNSDIGQPKAVLY